MREHISSHLRLHIRSYHVTVILHEIPQHKAQKIQSEHDKPGKYHRAEFAVRDKIVKHPPGDYRIYHADKGDKKRGKHIRGKHQLMRFIIRYKTF